MQCYLKSDLKVLAPTTTRAMTAGGSGGRRKGHHKGRNSRATQTTLNRRELDTYSHKLGQQGGFQGLLHSEKGTTHLDSGDRRKRALCFFLGNCFFLRKSNSG